jgi:hypothetical protein
VTLDDQTELRAAGLDEMLCPLQHGWLEPFDVYQNPVRLKAAAHTEVIQRDYLDLDAFAPSFHQRIGMVQAASPVRPCDVEYSSTRIRPDGVRKYFDPLSQMVDPNVSLQSEPGPRIGFERNDSAVWSRPVRELYHVQADIGTHVQA